LKSEEMNWLVDGTSCGLAPLTREYQGQPMELRKYA